MTLFQQATAEAKSLHWERVALAPLPTAEPEGRDTSYYATPEYRERMREATRQKKSRPGWRRRPELDWCEDRKQYRRNYMRLVRGKELETTI